jgi:hypothetical protein
MLMLLFNIVLVKLFLILSNFASIESYPDPILDYPFKGIVSRDFAECFFMSIDMNFLHIYGACSFAFKITFSCRRFDFRVSA